MVERRSESRRVFVRGAVPARCSPSDLECLSAMPGRALVLRTGGRAESPVELPADVAATLRQDVGVLACAGWKDAPPPGSTVVVAYGVRLRSRPFVLPGKWAVEEAWCLGRTGSSGAGDDYGPPYSRRDCPLDRCILGTVGEKGEIVPTSRQYIVEPDVPPAESPDGVLLTAATQRMPVTAMVRSSGSGCTVPPGRRVVYNPGMAVVADDGSVFVHEDDVYAEVLD